MIAWGSDWKVDYRVKVTRLKCKSYWAKILFKFLQNLYFRPKLANNLNFSIICRGLYLKTPRLWAPSRGIISKTEFKVNITRLQ